MLLNSSYKKLRKLLINDIKKIIKLPDSIFENAIVETIILVSQKDNHENIVL
jgi:type I restriction-modification system DNA methylase subunit